MRILVLGAGAIGGYFGGRLIEAGGDVTFLVRAPRAAALARDGLKVMSPLGDISVPVRTITADRVLQPFDLVLLSCKAYDLDDAMGSIAPAIGVQTALLPLLNGVVHIPRLGERFGSSRVLGGVAHLAVTLRTDGVIHHLNSQCAIRFGPLQGRPRSVVADTPRPAEAGARRCGSSVPQSSRTSGTSLCFLPPWLA